MKLLTLSHFQPRSLISPIDTSSTKRFGLSSLTQMRVEVPTNPKLVAAALRGQDAFAENYWEGSGAIVKPTGQIVQEFGGPAEDTFVKARATLQPLEVGMLIKTVKAQQKLGIKVPRLSEKDLTVLMTHNQGEPQQTKHLQRLIHKFDIHQDTDLVCEPSHPQDPSVQYHFIREGLSPSLLYHPCLPHHLTLILLSQLIHAAPKEYWDPKGKLQQLLSHSLRRSTDPVQPEPYHALQMVEYDQCFIPTFTMSLKTLGALYAQLVADKDFAPLLKGVKEHSDLLGNRSHFDTQLVQVSEGNLIPKSSKGGLICIANQTTKEAMVIKLWSGQGDTTDHIRDRVTLKALLQAGWLTQKQYESIHLPTIPMLEKVHPKTKKPIGQVAIEQYLWTLPKAEDVSALMLEPQDSEVALTVEPMTLLASSNASKLLNTPQTVPNNPFLAKALPSSKPQASTLT
ncbi:MAG: asparaginase [Vampirovibrionales bacterium]